MHCSHCPQLSHLLDYYHLYPHHIVPLLRVPVSMEYISDLRPTILRLMLLLYSSNGQST
ncbi:hypothetical protein K503DRAFT_765800 [Rhizopogon vinicolor AM-OR11-026]|uniref:Uncharacterized protein n=1 Tax=Rhizopogon vinicolor AM-OR11-026 TaxID=1314800 RepID=A0A1B7NF12_9AGAM|nr:hypothetical protein K503DRAFT_765800 [Rhizopogon vinicolor AM-OR11-026]